VVELDEKVAHWQLGQNLLGDGDDLCIRHHRREGASHVKIALIKLAIAAACKLRLVSAVHLGHVVALDVAHGVHG
jgi:hypothetical protein